MEITKSRRIKKDIIDSELGLGFINDLRPVTFKKKAPSEYPQEFKQHNPNKTERDNLYKNGVNPVVSFSGQGTLLFGDKTLLAKPSAFDRINVRRLFITLEKSIANFAQFSMFEFNDDFTRASFVSSVEPFLRDIQGRGGITDFSVICDESNNTQEVIDRNEFIGSIFIKPTKSINFILLNFVAVRSGVDFEEVVNAV